MRKARRPRHAQRAPAQVGLLCLAALGGRITRAAAATTARGVCSPLDAPWRPGRLRCCCCRVVPAATNGATAQVVLDREVGLGCKYGRRRRQNRQQQVHISLSLEGSGTFNARHCIINTANHTRCWYNRQQHSVAVSAEWMLTQLRNSGHS
jgi:hypothetical protein